MAMQLSEDVLQIELRKGFHLLPKTIAVTLHLKPQQPFYYVAIQLVVNPGVHPLEDVLRVAFDVLESEIGIDSVLEALISSANHLELDDLIDPVLVPSRFGLKEVQNAFILDGSRKLNGVLKPFRVVATANADSMKQHLEERLVELVVLRLGSSRKRFQGVHRFHLGKRQARLRQV